MHCSKKHNRSLSASNKWHGVEAKIFICLYPYSCTCLIFVIKISYFKILYLSCKGGCLISKNRKIS